MDRKLKPERLLVENIRALLASRRMDASALAVWCGHKPPWISKILNVRSGPNVRGVKVKDLGKIADFFGLTVSELFQHGISTATERRHKQRRVRERRNISDRRTRSQHEHPDTQPRFPPKRDNGSDGPPLHDPNY